MQKILTINNKKNSTFKYFNMNKRYIFFYNDKCIKYIPITDEFKEENLIPIKLVIEENDQDVSIQEIRIGSDSNRIMIILA